MTRDTTRPESMLDGMVRLKQLVAETRYVLFDFDGPICQLFAGHPSAEIARRLKDWLEEQGHQELVAQVAESTDPQDVLRAAGAARPGSKLVEMIERKLTEEEEVATGSARPTPYADPLIRTLVAIDRQLAVTTNNSASAAAKYLASRGLGGCFGRHIYGRTKDLSLLKPHPDCLDRALASLGSAPHQAMMIGDTPADALAARSAGTRFLGYAHDERKADDLYAAGAPLVIDSLEHLLEAARGQGA